MQRDGPPVHHQLRRQQACSLECCQQQRLSPKLPKSQGTKSCAQKRKESMRHSNATCDVDVPIDRQLEAPGLDQGDRVEEISVSKKMNQSTKMVRLSPNFLQSNASGNLRPRGKLNQGFIAQVGNGHQKSQRFSGACF